ncbi:MAG: sigma-54 factor interaction domain-containing protein, partial [Silvanigrellaceae bacterium]|nr:sigma-54 factor interaction domain-containing protein [Silvanigrellaceae bacterium]
MNSCFALMGTSPTIRHVQHLVFKVTDIDTPVIITGESGTGKDLVAKAIHDRSPRASQPFVPIKCAALSEEEIEIEIFGERSPNSQGRPGGLILAGGGTVYIDEISKLSLPLQSLLLQAIQEKTIYPQGPEKAIQIQSRVICSS